MMLRNNIFNLQGVDIFLIDNFLTSEECQHFCQLIKRKNEPSSVVGQGEEYAIYDKGRTSNSAYFYDNDPVVAKVDERIATELNIPVSHGEPMQGQLYTVGQFFNDHVDYFTEYTLANQKSPGGQRTWTCMIYLNAVEEGGHTEFPMLGKSFAPKIGTALFWKNSDGQGTENPATLHCGCSVVRGEKMIITKWFHEHPYQNNFEQSASADPKKIGLTEIATQHGEPIYVKIEDVQGIPHARYKKSADIPAITKEGFKKVPIPTQLYQEILGFYNNGRQQSKPEFDSADPNHHLSSYIKSNETRYPTELIQLTPAIVKNIFHGAQEILETWSGRKLAPTHCYGIRTYRRGATLKKHIDGFETRIISAILNVDQQVDEPWALQIDDHNGIEHEIFLQPGEMALYESAVLRHGRVKPLNGDYFSNLFVHFINVT